MTVVVQCKRCGKELRAKARYAGMPTRCPRCQTINQLPSKPLSSPSEKASPAEGKTPKRQPTPECETCKICGKPIRGKAERFADIHGTIYHLGCYQKQAGEASEDACRICGKRFEGVNERVKDVVGFCYHRRCYKEEVERQRREISGDGKPGDGAVSPSKRTAKPVSKAVPKPKAAPKPKAVSADDKDDWDLTPDIEDDWMQPDREELELKEDLPTHSAPAPSAPKASAPKASAPKASAPKASAPKASAPKASAPKASAPKLRSADAASSAERLAAKARPGVAGKSSGGAKPGPKKPPPDAPPKKKPTTRKAKQLPRAKPIAEPPQPAGLPAGLELLPEESGNTALEGLEILGDAQAIPAANVVRSQSANPPGGGKVTPGHLPASGPGFTPLDGLDVLGDLAPLDNLDPFGESTPGQPVQRVGVGGRSPATAVQGVLLDPLTGQPASLGAGRRGGGNSIPTWLWVVMGAGIAVVVIMLVLAVVSSVRSDNGNRPVSLDRQEKPQVDDLARSDPTVDQGPIQPHARSNSSGPEIPRSVAVLLMLAVILVYMAIWATIPLILLSPLWALRMAIKKVTGRDKSWAGTGFILLKMTAVNILVSIVTLPINLIPVVGQVICCMIAWKYASSVLGAELGVDEDVGSSVLWQSTLILLKPILFFLLLVVLLIAVSIALSS